MHENSIWSYNKLRTVGHVVGVPAWLEHLQTRAEHVGGDVRQAAQGLGALWSLHQPGTDGTCDEDGKPWPCGTANLLAYWLGQPINGEDEDQ